MNKEVVGLLAKFRNMRHYVYIGATLATFLLATGAKFKNN